MKRTIKLVSVLMLFVMMTVGVAGCFGNFAAIRKVYTFNENFGDKWMSQVMFYVLSWIPVYGIASFADVVLFNTIEFWTGSNPMAMNENEEIIKYANHDGKDLKIIIRQNEVMLEDMSNPGEEIALRYKPFEKSWYLDGEEGAVKIATLNEDGADFFQPDGKVVSISNIQ